MTESIQQYRAREARAQRLEQLRQRFRKKAPQKYTTSRALKKAVQIQKKLQKAKTIKQPIRYTVQVVQKAKYQPLWFGGGYLK